MEIEKEKQKLKICKCCILDSLSQNLSNKLLIRLTFYYSTTIPRSNTHITTMYITPYHTNKRQLIIQNM